MFAVSRPVASCDYACMNYADLKDSYTISLWAVGIKRLNVEGRCDRMQELCCLRMSFDCRCLLIPTTFSSNTFPELTNASFLHAFEMF